MLDIESKGIKLSSIQVAARKPRQQELDFHTWGGGRKGAGRKRRPGSCLRHEARPALDGRTPVHVTLRISNLVPNLRGERCLHILRRAFREGREREGFRLVHYAVQPDHLHLIVEASNKTALSSGIRGLSIRIARQLNGTLGRRGKVFADRYHGRSLKTPREVRNALAYVLLQAQRHAAKRRGAIGAELIDPCSSAPLFEGFTRGRRPRAGPWDETVVAPSTWLLKTGWKRYGLIDPTEVPGGG
jgi:REP element-mobilizing transposase RayT